ncbi:MAG: hypothetical protein R2856_02520 [Caldilineaceae bacterium]
MTLWPLVIGMFIIGVYPTALLLYFNTSAQELVNFVSNLNLP